MPSQMDLLCSNSQLPQSYLNAAPKNKRHTIHKKKNIMATNPDVDMEELVNRPDIPPDVKKVLQDLELIKLCIFITDMNMYCSLNKKKIFSEIIYFLNKNKNTKKKNK